MPCARRHGEPHVPRHTRTPRQACENGGMSTHAPPAGAPPRWLRAAPVVFLLIWSGSFVFLKLGLRYTDPLTQGVSAGAVALITSQQLILIGLLAPAVAGGRVGALRWAGLVLGVLGACVVILANASVSVASPGGLLFALMALLSLTAGTLWEKRYGVSTHPIMANLVQCTVGLLVLAPLAYLLEPMHVQWTPALLGSLAYLVFATSLVAITLLLAMIRQG
jgi:drug/metabolite transporter (DMT)-like permease